MSTLQHTCIARRMIDYALLLCREFATKLPHQVCHDKLISRKITLAASVHAIWVVANHLATARPVPKEVRTIAVGGTINATIAIPPGEASFCSNPSVYSRCPRGDG
ncbi:hypothetical protein AVEN_159957-1 [Araneus ventricosus]|uniref:Uncharacterized protein n=1 Tax=Araneus ventricosus TaxID=182803 RepID=A0A4Y2I265_ARAVE|nr:hypothetical protein AVEN_159957-1 [Araneus ventricosus]